MSRSAPLYAATVTSTQVGGLPRYSQSSASSLYPSRPSSSSSSSFPSSSFPFPSFLDLPDYDFLVKTILVGDSGVGKSALLTRFASNKFLPADESLSTIGVDFEVRTMRIADKIVKLQIWDTAGQDRFKTITTSYYRGSHIILLVFDVTCRSSSQNLGKWLKEIDQYIKEDAMILVVANKCDLMKTRFVNREEIESMCRELEEQLSAGENGGRMLEWIETSAKSNENVMEAFVRMNERYVREKCRRIANGEDEEGVEKAKGSPWKGRRIDTDKPSWICPNGCTVQ